MRRAMVLTAEGMGDDSSATYSEVSDDGVIREHFRSNDVNLGRLYRYVTLLLGMKRTARVQSYGFSAIWKLIQWANKLRCF